MEAGWEEHLDKLAEMYEMKNRDEIHISRATMPDFDAKVCLVYLGAKLKMFFEEHLHRDAEVRFIKAGTGFFDVRSAEDEWIRIPVKSGDFVYLPAGIYHRFTTDRKEDLTAIRLFKMAPKWEAFNRCMDGDSLEKRKDYLKVIAKTQ
ncbi:ARD/ARD' family protein [Teladorsagia circumcincta]|uniref:acireductone dioxygenase (Fe(2+)-requiring) n=1 Tax=Teladorsagia circumcincta TaxID=45464 RepID=A0A2G9V221_TELCI|nr:ARD/ARD' family protein [Teladorsagia circumcincta]